jgi:hypothetical protein
MALVVIAWLFLFEGQASWVLGIGGVVLGGVAYWIAALLLKAPEARQLPKLLLSKS